MDNSPFQSAPEPPKVLSQELPIIHIVRNHSMRVQLMPTESVAATETMIARVGDLRNLLKGWAWEYLVEKEKDALVTLKVSHRYPKLMGHPKDVLLAAYPSSQERSTRESRLASKGIKEGKNWSSALVALERSDRASQTLSPEAIRNVNGFVELNRFCCFCRHLLSASRAFNAHVYEEDSAMPKKEPPNSDNNFEMPNRHTQEYFDFWPSSAEMLASARSGCHLCTIICQELFDRLDNFDDSGERRDIVPSSGPVKLVVDWTWWYPVSRVGEWSFRPAGVSRSLWVEWPLNDAFDGLEKGPQPYLPEPRQSVRLEIGVDGTSDVQHARNPDTSPSSLSFSGRQSPSLGNRKEHLLSCYTGSEAVLTLARRWISTCHTEHGCHKDTGRQAHGLSFRPTRLLDVGDSSGTQKPRLNVKTVDSGPVQYLALSHCWGKKARELYRLTTENEEELLQGVHIGKLSQTFQDAIGVCRKLKERYIWIDSLCIKQDDKHDWTREAAQMHLVYANAYCTIGAVCARGGEEGFLRARNPRVLQACNFPTKVCVSIAGLRQRDLSKMPLRPLFDRAWTLQERLLSPCMLRFDEDTIAWECQECKLTEEDCSILNPPRVAGVSRTSMMSILSNQDPVNGLPFQRGFLVLWSALIYMYTEMALTEPRDRIFAFQGITSYMARFTSKSGSSDGGVGLTFFDGLPVQFLLPSLLWRVVDSSGQRVSQSITKNGVNTCILAECHVNTLSWASVQAPARLDYPHQWPKCAAAFPATTIFAPEYNSGTFVLSKRTQLIELFAHNKPGINNENGEKPLPYMYRGERTWAIARYRYCTRVVSLIHVDHLLSRVCLKGPTFNFLTPSILGSSMLSPSGCMDHWDFPEVFPGPKNSFTLMDLDLGCLRVSHFGLAMRVVCLTVIEWEWNQNYDLEVDMSQEDPDSWQPNCAAGIVLIRSKDMQDGVGCGKAEELYTRIGYWELVAWKEYHPSYGPIRKEAKVRRVTVI